MNYDEISKKICRLAELTNNWSSTIIIPQDDAFLNISSAAVCFAIMLLSCKLYSKFAHQRYAYFRKDIDYYCVVHVSGEGIFAHAKGRPTEETHIHPRPPPPKNLPINSHPRGNCFYCRGGLVNRSGLGRGCGLDCD